MVEGEGIFSLYAVSKIISWSSTIPRYVMLDDELISTLLIVSFLSLVGPHYEISVALRRKQQLFCQQRR